MNTTVYINNLQCEDCKNFLYSLLHKLKGISNSIIDLETKTLNIDFKSHNAIEGLRLKLTEIGYPINYDPSVIIE